MFRRLSLTSRLTAFFTVVASAIVLGLGLLFMVAVDQHFMELDRSTLEDKKHLIEDLLTNAKSVDDTGWRLKESLSNHDELFVRVKYSTGETIFESAGFAPSGHQAAAAVQRGHALQLWNAGGRERHSLNFQATPKFSPSASFEVTLAIDTKRHQLFLNELQRSLKLYLVMAMLVSGLLGWLAAHQGMAPLRAMKNKVAGVTGHQLQERMPMEAVPIEMADLARELNRMLDRLRSDFLRLSEFSSDLAHELRTPLSNLLTQTQVTLTSTRDAATYRNILESNAEELQRLARMVSDMLLLAKTERGVDLPSKEYFSAGDEVQALLEFYEAVAEEKRIRLWMHGDGDIQGDRLMFRRAMSNLLSNALRHTPQDGEVSIGIAKSLHGTEVTVENTGEDIDPHVLPRLFDRFYRADPARSHPTSDGAGLGLAITKAIVEAHGGKAVARSENGRTRFSLTFPH